MSSSECITSRWSTLLRTAITVSALSGCAISTNMSAPLPSLPVTAGPATIFAPGVISTGDVFASTFTPDGRTVIFTKFSPPRMTLMTSTFVDGGWSAPVALPFSGTFRDLDPSFSPDGTRLYFSSWRPRDASTNDTTNASDTWYVDRVGNGWGTPVRLADPANSTDVDMFPSVTQQGVLYFDSFRSQPRRRLVYRAAPRGDGTYGTPVALDTTINADSGASNLFVDPQEQYVIFAAARPEGRGALDLYISQRTRNGSWSPARNLGPDVNGTGTEFCPFVTRDGGYLFFTRISAPGVTPITRNIYVVRFDASRAGT